MSKFFTAIILMLTMSGYCQFYPVRSGSESLLYDLHFADKNLVFVSGSSGTILRSKDKGTSWEQLESMTDRDLYAVCFLNEKKGFVAGNRVTLLKTLDGGATWQPVALNATGYDFRRLYFKNAHEGFLVGGGSDGRGGIMFTTQDGGETWSDPVFYPSPIQSITFSGDLGITTGSFGSIMRSIDGGKSWQAQITGVQTNQVLVSSSIVDDNIIFIVGGNGEIYKSIDAGLNYSLLPTGTSDYLFSVHFFDELHGYISGGSIANNKSRILRTSDGGENWLTVPTDASRLTGIGFNEEADGLVVGLNGTILKFDSEHNTIVGKVYATSNGDCTKGGEEKGISGIILKGEPGPYYAVSAADGTYRMPVGKAGSYSIDVVSKNIGQIALKCEENGSTIVFNAPSQQIDTVDLGLKIIDCSLLKVAINSDRRRRCFTSNTYVNYSNEGLLAENNVRIGVVFPEHVVPLWSKPSWTSRIDSLYFFEIGVVEAGASGQIRIIDSVVCGDEGIRGLTACTRAFISPVGTCNEEFKEPDQSWDRSSIKVTGGCSGGVVNFTILNGGSDMSGHLEYRVFVNDTLIKKDQFMLKSGGQKNIEVLADGKTIRLEADQHPKHPGRSRPRETVEACAGGFGNGLSMGFVANVPLDNLDEFIDEECLPIIDSYDPNDKLVFPSGLLDRNYIYKDDVLDYVIRFQNTGTDTAYTVKIKDTLDMALDPATVTLLGSSHHYFWNLETISGKHILTFTFPEIYLPDSTTNEPASNGFIRFRIAQKGDNLPGTVIKNEAGIYFDFNSAIITNTTISEVWNIIPVDLDQGYRVMDVVTSKLDRALDLKVLPNPFTDAFSVQVKNKGVYHILIIDARGQIFYDKYHNMTVGGDVRVAGFEGGVGIYQMKVSSEDGRMGMWKVVKY